MLNAQINFKYQPALWQVLLVFNHKWLNEKEQFGNNEVQNANRILFEKLRFEQTLQRSLESTDAYLKIATLFIRNQPQKYFTTKCYMSFEQHLLCTFLFDNSNFWFNLFQFTNSIDKNNRAVLFVKFDSLILARIVMFQKNAFSTEIWNFFKESWTFS